MMSDRPSDLVTVVSGATGEETSDAGPTESGAGGPGDAVSLWAAGPPHQSTDAAGRSTCLTSTSFTFP